MIRRVRSSRQLEYQLKHSIDFMWLVSGRTIDYSTICAFRREHEKGLKELFKQMIGIAVDLNMANLADLCIDGTRILGNASRSQTWTAERLEKALAILDGQIAEALQGMDLNDQTEDLYGQDVSFDQLPKELTDQQARSQKLKEILAKIKRWTLNVKPMRHRHRYLKRTPTVASFPIKKVAMHPTSRRWLPLSVKEVSLLMQMLCAAMLSTRN